MLVLTGLVAIGGSTATVFALNTAAMAGITPAAFSLPSANETDENAENGYYRVAQSSTLPDFTTAAESTVNGVVSIKSFATPGSSSFNPFDDDIFEFFFGPQQRRRPNRQSEPEEQRQTGLGSGVIISDDGYIVTNNHVVEEAERLEVTLNDNRSFNATVIGTDPSTDLALIKIDATGLPVIPMGDSDKLKVGEWTLAVGNPFGFTSTVTAGIVSAKARSIKAVTHSNRNMGIEAYIQTDAAVNPGNSGGALVNLRGELVGINTAIYSNTGSYTGYSFAIPTSIVKKVVSDIRQYGSVQRAMLGIGISDLTPELARKNDITAVTEGVFVNNVNELSGAREAGIEEGDVIIAVNNVPVKNCSALQEQVARFSPGNKVKLTYIRNNATKTAEVTLLNSQGNTELTRVGSIADLNCAFKVLSNETCEQLGLQSGVQIVGIKNGRVKDAGIKDGFIIRTINDIPVTKVDDVERIYNAIMKSDGDHVMFVKGLYPTGQRNYYAIDLN